LYKRAKQKIAQIKSGALKKKIKFIAAKTKKNIRLEFFNKNKSL